MLPIKTSRKLTPEYAHKSLNNALFEINSVVIHSAWKGSRLSNRLSALARDINILMNEIVKGEHDIDSGDL